MAHDPVDIVYTWVKGEDPDYRRMVAQYSGKPQHTNPERYRDQFDLLRYSLRSVEKNFPSYRLLYLVTMRPQLPDWLNQKNPRLRIVHHDELFPSAEFLPTFNHNTIESYLHLLPGIAYRFVYMNDDFLYGQKIEVDDLFPSGRPRIFGSLWGEKWKFRITDGSWLSLGFIEHCPVPILKSAWSEMQSIAPEEILATRRGKFRDKHHIRMDRLYTYYMLKYRLNDCTVSPFWKTRKNARFVKIGNDLESERRTIAKLIESPRKFVCLNDDQGDEPDPNIIRAYRNYLAATYPSRSSFEKIEQT
jgi:hypothetical protein